MDKRKVIVIDDALSTEDTESFRDQHFCMSETEHNRWVDRGNQPNYITSLIKAASEYIDIESAVGYEWWTHKNTYTNKGWHIDYDEEVWCASRTLKTPLCSIIYYPLVAHIKGGEFVLEDLKIPAKTNRMIIVSAKEPHKINNYNTEEADRWSFLINPWIYKPEAATPSWHITDIKEA
jgi:hypothetical protein